MKLRFLPGLLFGALPVLAQLSAPNAAGVSAGHDIFTFKDRDAAARFWTALGGEPAQLGPLNLTKFPGMLFYYPRSGNPTGGTEGSTIDYIGFKVKSLKDTLGKLAMVGGKPLTGDASIRDGS